ncbi:MAG: hypothetical protein LC792_21620 [Actinobacteria bacterium]|nr:hypothetical protein [Actinomycetota bacterium]
MVVGTATLQTGRLDLETIVRAPLVVVADPVVAASGPPASLDELKAAVATASSTEAGSPAKPPVSVGCLGGGGVALLERPGGTILALANPEPDAALFVWVSSDFLAVVADPDRDTALDHAGGLTIGSGRLVAGAPDVIAAWGPDVDTGDGSAVRARMHRGRVRLGLIVVAHVPSGRATVAAGAGAASVSYPTSAVVGQPPLPLAG